MPKVRYTYVGRRLSTTGPLGYFYIDEEGEERGFKKTLYSGARVGNILELDTDEAGVLLVGRVEHVPVVIGSTPDDDPRVLQWTIEDKAASVARSRKVQSDKKVRGTTDPLAVALEPIRDEMLGMSRERRTATLAFVIDYLLNGVTR